MMTPDDVATALLTVGGRSLWRELEEMNTPPGERRYVIRPSIIHDRHCERLLLGCIYAYGPLAMTGVYKTPLVASDFYERNHRPLYTTSPAIPEDLMESITCVGMIDQYLDAASAVNRRWLAEGQADGVLPGECPHVDATIAAQGLALRIVRLARVRDLLQQAENLLNHLEEVGLKGFRIR